VIGVKSTSIKFKKNLKLFIGMCYFLSSLFISFVMIKMDINFGFLFIFLFMASLFYQIKIFSIKKPKNSLKAFKLNNLSGLFVFLAILIEVTKI